MFKEDYDFTVTILHPCHSSTLDPPVVADMLAYISLPADTQTISTPLDSVSGTLGNNDGITFCGTRNYAISPNTFSFLDLTGSLLTLQSNDPSDYPTFETITLTVSLQNYPTVTSSDTFTVTLDEICMTTTLDPPVASDMLAYIHQGPDTQMISTPLDTVSGAYGSMDGTTYCGDRNYAVSPTTWSWLDLTVDELSISSNLPSDAPAAETITLTASLADWPAISS